MDQPRRLTPESYFALARERYGILLKRRAGLPPPWTTDPVFSAYRFCNVHREDDRTTIWFKDHVRHRHPNDLGRTLLNTIAFRWFNRIETGEVLLENGLFDNWSIDEARRVLTGRKPVVTGAYVINTIPGTDKLNGVLNQIENLVPHVDRFAETWFTQHTSLQAACDLLQQFPRLGGFMAHQLAADLKYTPVLGGASDRLTWAFPGPGTTRGASRVLYGEPNILNRTNPKHMRLILDVLREFREHSTNEYFWPADWPVWEMSDVSNWFCESDKHCRVTLDGERMKQRYNPK